MNVIQKLLIVQEHDCRIRDLDKESRDVPKRKEDEQNRLKEHKEALSKAEDALKGRLAELKKLELETEANKEKIVKLRSQQLQIETNKEFKTIEGEIKVIQDAISSIEDNQLVVMEEVETAKLEVHSKKAALAEEEKEIQKDVLLLDQRVLEIAAELKAIREKRDFEAREVDPRWLAQYERIFKRKDKGLVQIEDGVCGGCHMTLPPAVVHVAKRSDHDMVVCDFCGRLLYS